MAKKTTLNDIAAMLAKQGEILSKHGKEITDLSASVAQVVKHMATKEDLEKLATKEQLTALHMQVNSIEAQLKLGRYEQRLGHLEEKVFGAPRR
jgi:hypothetical protein